MVLLEISPPAPPPFLCSLSVKLTVRAAVEHKQHDRKSHALGCLKRKKLLEEELNFNLSTIMTFGVLGFYCTSFLLVLPSSERKEMVKLLNCYEIERLSRMSVLCRMNDSEI